MARRRAKGEGSITKRKNGTWQAEYHLGYDPNGKRIRKFVYGKTQREVREKLDQVKRQHADGNLAGPDVTMTSYLREWLATKARNVKPRTTELYTHYIEKHTIPRIGRTKLAKFTPLQAQRLVGTIADEVGANTANKVRSLLKSAYQQAVRLQLVNRNPFDAVDPLKETPREMQIWSLEEAVRFLDTARTHRLYAAFFLMLSTGLRRGEVLGLRWDDINGNLLRVQRSIALRRNQAVITPPKTESGKRVVALSEDDLQVLNDHRQRQLEELEALAAIGGEWEDPWFIFVSEVGTLVHPRNFERTWYTLRKKAGVTPVRLHDLRHFHVSLLLYKGIDLRTIADRVGHADPAFTLRVYSHILAETRQNAAVSLNELLGVTPAPREPN